ncbi:MAG: GTP cyclohydrolase I FolE [Planctomycetota bacterium]|nr:MAG: GTP cyclohydrolase I FolE [Planctomycetota bacterium]
MSTSSNPPLREQEQLRGLPGTASPELSELIRRLLIEIGEDPSREGLVRTPDRVARAYQELLSGNRRTVEQVVGEGVFHEDCSEMVLVRDIEFYSLCEHHMLPFFGRVHVAYIPDGRIIGLSKIPRIVDVFARRLQVQERMTIQIAEALQATLQPKGVGVVAYASHLCMMMRGVQKQNSSAMTSCLLGCFRSDARTRGEFFGLVNAEGR